MAVSSEFPESDSASEADFADLATWTRWAWAPAASARAEHHGAALEAARRLDARSVIEGQMALEEFKELWNTDPYAIVALRANQPPAYSLYGGESAPDHGQTRYQTGTTKPNTPPPAIRVDEEKGVRRSAQHSGTAAGQGD